MAAPGVGGAPGSANLGPRMLQEEGEEEDEEEGEEVILESDPDVDPYERSAAEASKYEVPHLTRIEPPPFTRPLATLPY